MAKKKAARGKAGKKKIATKKVGESQTSTKQRDEGATLHNKRVATTDTNRLPALAAIKAAGATAIAVHYQGHGDDGCYDCRVIGKSDHLTLAGEAFNEVTSFLQQHVYHNGIGEGSVLLATFDLTLGACRGLSGGGSPDARFAELLELLEDHGVKKLVGEIHDGQFSKCKVIPETALARKKASDYVNRFIYLAQDFASEFGEEYRDFCNEHGEQYQGEVLEVLGSGDGKILIDVPASRVSFSPVGSSRGVDIKVDVLRRFSIPFQIS
jgi:hypothetical protein